jgi:hypothetical protein
MVLPILIDAVTAGEGALRTWIMCSAWTIRKSSSTGTEGGKSDLALCLAFFDGKQRISADSNGQIKAGIGQIKMLKKRA